MTQDNKKSVWDDTYQVAVVVRDMDKAVEFYESLGIGPFTEGPSGSTVARQFRQEDAPDVKVVGRVAQMGPIEFELMQPVAGYSIHQEFLDNHGEGLFHICAYTDDLQRDIEDMKSKGCEVVASLELDDGGKAAHFDTRKIGGMFLELFQRGSQWS